MCRNEHKDEQQQAVYRKQPIELLPVSDVECRHLQVREILFQSSVQCQQV